MNNDLIDLLSGVLDDEVSNLVSNFQNNAVDMFDGELGDLNPDQKPEDLTKFFIKAFENIITSSLNHLRREKDDIDVILESGQNICEKIKSLEHIAFDRPNNNNLYFELTKLSFNDDIKNTYDYLISKGYSINTKSNKSISLIEYFLQNINTYENITPSLRCTSIVRKPNERYEFIQYLIECKYIFPDNLTNILKTLPNNKFTEIYELVKDKIDINYVDENGIPVIFSFKYDAFKNIFYDDIKSGKIDITSTTKNGNNIITFMINNVLYCNFNMGIISHTNNNAELFNLIDLLVELGADITHSNNDGNNILLIFLENFIEHEKIFKSCTINCGNVEFSDNAKSEANNKIIAIFDYRRIFIFDMPNIKTI